MLTTIKSATKQKTKRKHSTTQSELQTFARVYSRLKNIFENITPLRDEEWFHIKNSFVPITVPGKQLLTTLGETENSVYFILEGVVRLFCHNLKGEEVTIFLFKEDFFASSYHSFITQTPGNQALETVEECRLLCLKKTAMDELYRRVPKMNLITRIIAEQRFINAQKIFTSQIIHTPEERYLQFVKNHGDLLLRVPHHIIASFLGMTPVSMSRIRNRINRK